MKLLLVLWGDGVVPFREEIVELDGCSNDGFHFVRRFPTGFVDSVDHIHSRAKSGTRGRLPHQFDDSLQRIKQHARADAAQMRKQTTLDRIVFRAVTRVVGHTNGHLRAVGNQLKIVLEKILAGRVAAAAIKQQQHAARLRIRLLSDAIPVPLNTVARELRRITRQTKIYVPAVANQIVDAVRNQHAFGPRRKVVIKRTKRSVTTHPTRAEQLAQMLFRLGINGEHRRSLGLERVDQGGNVAELSIAIFRSTTCEDFANLPPSQLLLVHPAADKIVAGRRLHRGQFAFDSRRSQVGEANRFVVGITCGTSFDE